MHIVFYHMLVSFKYFGFYEIRYNIPFKVALRIWTWKSLEITYFEALCCLDYSMFATKMLYSLSKNVNLYLGDTHITQIIATERKVFIWSL
jgi:hypothetical protein